MSDTLGIGGIAQAAGNVASAAIQANAISSAADKQAATAKYAQDLIQGRYDTTRDDFSTYRDLGNVGANRLLAGLDEFAAPNSPWAMPLQQNLPTVPQAMTIDNLRSTPGYQFTLDQGLKSTQNSAAARGLGVSGAALKGAAAYATGLSDQTYNQRFQQQQALFNNQQNVFGDIQNLYSNYETSKSNAWNRLAGLVNTGLSGAGQTASIGASAAAQGAQIAQNAGNAQAAAGVATGNAISGGLNGVGNAISQSDTYNRLTGGGIYGNNSGYGYDAPDTSSKNSYDF